MNTARTKIDVHGGTLTMEFDGEVIKFKIFEDLPTPNVVHSICSVAVHDDMPEGSGDGKSCGFNQISWKTWLEHLWEHYNIPFIEWIKNKFVKPVGRRSREESEFMAEKQVILRNPG